MHHGVSKYGFESQLRGGAGMSVVSVVIVRYRSLRRTDHSSRGVLPTVVRRCVCSRNLVNEEAMSHSRAVAPKPNTPFTMLL